MGFFQSNRPAMNKVATVPAPTGGLNARDSLANMPETDALVLSNWWPQTYGCLVRPGYREWATGLPGVVDTLATWASTDGTTKLFAWAGTELGSGMYDVTTRMLPGHAAPVPIVDTLSSARWETVQQVNDAGAHLLAVNGIDEGIVYNATGAQRLAYVAVPPVPPAVPADFTWYGLDSKEVVQLTSHQGRLWATKKDSSVGYYGGVDAIYGEFKPFDFGPQFTFGGYLAFMTTWTIDDGNGAEDHLVAVSSKGQAIVYGGTDPGTITTWSLVGVYFIGEPVIGRRGYFKVGGDIMILTQRGLISMATMLVSTKVNESVSTIKPAKVQLLVSTLVSEFADLQDWELYYNASNNLFLVNIPSKTLGGNRQLAANEVTDACPWCFFADVDAATWATFNGEPFFGDYQGRVLKFWDGRVDEVPLSDITTNARAIRAQVQQAYSYFNAPAVQKQVGMYRPNFLVGASVAYNSRIEYDFQVQPVKTPVAIEPEFYSAVWDTSKWDEGRWGGGLYAERLWVQAIGIGSAASLRMTLVAEAEVAWVGTDYSFKAGTLL